MREIYPMPSREDTEIEISGAKYFPRLDANSGLYQMPLDEATSQVCTFRFLRLPFEFSSASEVFQKTLTDIFEGLTGVRIYSDDKLILYDKEVSRFYVEKTYETGLSRMCADRGFHFVPRLSLPLAAHAAM